MPMVPTPTTSRLEHSRSHRRLPVLEEGAAAQDPAAGEAPEPPRRPWRTLDEHAEPAAFIARHRDEFAEPLPTPVTTVPVGSADYTRRGVLGALGLSAALAGCSRAPVQEAVPFVDNPEGMVAGEPLWYATTCGGCDAGCGLLVKTRDGRPIKIEGNPEAAVGGGGTCAVGQATLLSLYDDARVKQPHWRGEPSSWETVDLNITAGLEAARRSGGKIALLTGAITSPTSRHLIQEWCRRFPNTRHVAYQPISTSAIVRANALCFGIDRTPHYRFDRARAVVGLDADFLGTWISPVAFQRDYVRGRRPGKGPDAKMSWHAQFESWLSLTGANADLRLPTRPTEVAAVGLALLERLERLADVAPSVSETRTHDAPWLPTVQLAAERLWRHRGAALVVCGANDVALQIVVNAINTLLESYGSTLEIAGSHGPSAGDERGLLSLVEDLRRGEIDALIVAGVNPAYDTPLAEEVANALASVPLSAAISQHWDETATLAHAVCPDHHFLEAWADCDATTGHLSLRQPVVSPLFETRSMEESLLRWMGRPTTAYAYLRSRWQDEIHTGRAEDFESFWAQAVHDGGATVDPSNNDASAAAARRDPALNTSTFHDPLDRARAEIVSRQATALPDDAGALELRLHQQIALRDGRHANNPWLQELPDPITRATWGNYAAVSPAWADERGLNDGDVVRLELGTRSLELPILRQPGQPIGSVAVALGYGRRAGGPIATGVGANAYPLVGLKGELFSFHRSEVRVTPTDRHQRPVLTQEHHTMEGRRLVKETDLDAYRADPRAGNHDREEHMPDLWQPRPELQHAWGLSIDLNACTGCAACVIACQSENNVPVVGPEEVIRSREMHWIRIDRYYQGEPEQPDVLFLPVMCQHCDHAPCETVCPVLATVHSSDGLNQQIYNRCVGTRYCANNCPYKVRRFNWFDYSDNDHFDYYLNNDVGKLVLNPDVTVRSRGVMEKCSMCIQRIQAGKRRAQQAGLELRDGDIQTACQQACPSDAIMFGDLADPRSRVSETQRNGRFYHLLEELNVQPSVGYLTKVHNRSSAAPSGPINPRRKTGTDHV